MISLDASFIATPIALQASLSTSNVPLEASFVTAPIALEASLTT